MWTLLLLCISMPLSYTQSVPITTLIGSSSVTHSFVLDDQGQNTANIKISIDATSLSLTDIEDLTYWVDSYDATNKNISGVQLINETSWEFITEIELMICVDKHDFWDHYVLQTGLNSILFPIDAMQNMKEHFLIYNVECNDPSIVNECHLAEWRGYNVTDGTSEYFQISFWISDSCDCIGCNHTELFCGDNQVGAHGARSDGCSICNDKDTEYIPGACPEPIVSNLSECGSANGVISLPYQSYDYYYSVNSSMYSAVTFSTCGSEINTKTRVYERESGDIIWKQNSDGDGWIDENTCDMNEDFVLYPIDIYDSKTVVVQIRAFGTETGNFNLTAICSNTAPPTTTSYDNYYPPDYNSRDVIMMNETLICGDSIHDALGNATDGNGIASHSYEFMVNTTTVKNVLFSTCSSSTRVNLQLSESSVWNDHYGIECGDDHYDHYGHRDDELYWGSLYFAKMANNQSDESISGYIDVIGEWETGDYLLDFFCSDGTISSDITCDDVIVLQTNGGIDTYKFNVDASLYNAVYFTTCDSEIGTKLQVTDANKNRIWSDSDFNGECNGDTSFVGWIDEYDGSSIYLDVMSWSSGSYTLNVACSDHTIAAEIHCGDAIFGNTLTSYGINYRFVNPVDQPVIFDICSASDVVELTLYDSNWSSPHNQIFTEYNDGNWVKNRTDCAHWEYFGEGNTNILAAGEYFLRVDRPAAFVVDVMCNEQYTFADPRTDDLIGDKCNYFQGDPGDEIWPIDECFVLGSPADNFTYSMHFFCNYDANGNVTVTQNWYMYSDECDASVAAYRSSTWEPSEIFSFHCGATESCSSVAITQFDDCSPNFDEPSDCMQHNSYEAGAYIVDECFVIQTAPGFESMKRICSHETQSLVEMYYAGFECADDYNYRNRTYDLQGFVGNRYFVFGSCPNQADVAQTTESPIYSTETTGSTNIIITSAETTVETTESSLYDTESTNSTQTTVETTAANSAESTHATDAIVQTAMETSEKGANPDEDPNSATYSKLHPMVIVLCCVYVFF